jgi:hypothetical protein
MNACEASSTSSLQLLIEGFVDVLAVGSSSKQPTTTPSQRDPWSEQVVTATDAAADIQGH